VWEKKFGMAPRFFNTTLNGKWSVFHGMYAKLFPFYSYSCGLMCFCFCCCFCFDFTDRAIRAFKFCYPDGHKRISTTQTGAMSHSHSQSQSHYHEQNTTEQHRTERYGTELKALILWTIFIVMCWVHWFHFHRMAVCLLSAGCHDYVLIKR